MTKVDKLKEIESFWKSKTRRYAWEDITWDPLTCEGQALEAKSVNEHLVHLRKVGSLLWVPGVYEIEINEEYQWEDDLLSCLHLWYSIPEGYHVPLYINETAQAICLPYRVRVDEMATLFQGNDSVILGMDGWIELQEQIKEEIRQIKSRPKFSSDNDNPFF